MDLSFYYNIENELSLKLIWRIEMGRQCKVSKEKFLEAYIQNKDKGILCLSIQLKMTKASVYAYLRRYDLEIPIDPEVDERNKLSAKIFSHYQGQRTITDISSQYGISKIAVRRYIEQEIIKLYLLDSPPRFAQPKTLPQIKIVKALVEADETGDAALWDEPERIMEYTNLGEEVVMDYLKYAFNRMWEDDQRHMPKGPNTMFLEKPKEIILQVSKPTAQRKLTPVEQLQKLCGTNKYKLFPEDEMIQLEKDQAMAKITLKGKEHLSPIEQLQGLMSEHLSNKIANFQNGG